MRGRQGKTGLFASILGATEGGRSGKPVDRCGKVCKSLIVDSVVPASRPRISTGCIEFSTGCICHFLPSAALFTSLSLSFFEGRKEGRGVGEHPRVALEIPRVVELPKNASTGFLPIHGLFRGNPWMPTI
jgi:hypothetical protein